MAKKSAPRRAPVADPALDSMPPLAAMLDDAGLPAEPAELEQLAALLAVPLELPELPSDLLDGVLAEIEQRGDTGAAGLLTALALVAGEPLAGAAGAAAERLGRRGVVSPVADRLGRLRVDEAVRIDGGDAELLVAVLRRPATRRVQVAILAIDRADTEGALVECMLSPPMPNAEARQILETPPGRDGPAPPEPISADELTARARAAAERTIAIGGMLGAEAGICLPLVARALTGDPHGLPHPATRPPWDDDDEELVVDAAEDEEGFHRVVELLLDEFEAFSTAAGPAPGGVTQYGDFVASSLLEWKGVYGDGRLGRWTEDDLDAFLFDHFPRKISADARMLDAVPECLIAFLSFLAERESLSGAPLDVLAAACLGMAEEFRLEATNRSNWGPAKSLAMQMHDDGVDPTDASAVAAWMEAFNARSPAERERVIGGALDRMAAGTGPPPVAGRGRTAKARRSQRAARKRNRRRK
jgi:hypothetical protein